MGAAAIPLMGAGMLMSAYGSYEAGRTNNAIARHNAELARIKEQQTLENGEFQAGVRDIKETNLAGAQAVGFAGQGVVAGAGSAGSVVAASNAMSEADKSMIRLNARREAWGLETSALSDEWQGKMAQRAGIMGAATSVVSGAGQMAYSSEMMSGGGNSSQMG